MLKATDCSVCDHILPPVWPVLNVILSLALESVTCTGTVDVQLFFLLDGGTPPLAPHRLVFMLGDSMVGSVSGEPSDFHCFLAIVLWVSLYCHSTFLDLTCLDYRLGGSFCFPSLLSMTGEVTGEVTA